MKATDQFFTIQQVSQQCNVPKSTLRFWEKKFQALITPDRSQGGQRKYTAEQVDLIANIKQLQTEGLSLEDIRQTIEQSVGADTDVIMRAQLDRLAEKVSALVKAEICRFFRGMPDNRLIQKK
jgi:MerR family transcriptional regulator, heat shock protein HspR